MKLLLFAAASLAFATPATADEPRHEHRFECQLSLASPAGFTAPSPVTIAFVSHGNALSGISVLDAGGILYPGGNLAISVRADGTVVMGGKAVPSERPGTWSGRAGKKSYDLELATPAAAKAVVIKLGAKEGGAGRFPLLWRAIGEPMTPSGQSISGSGTGSCASVNAGAPRS